MRKQLIFQNPKKDYEEQQLANLVYADQEEDNQLYEDSSYRYQNRGGTIPHSYSTPQIQTHKRMIVQQQLNNHQKMKYHIDSPASLRPQSTSETNINKNMGREEHFKQVYSKPKYHNYMRNGGPKQPYFDEENRMVKKYGNIFNVNHRRNNSMQNAMTKIKTQSVQVNKGSKLPMIHSSTPKNISSSKYDLIPQGRIPHNQRDIDQINEKHKDMMLDLELQMINQGQSDIMLRDQEFIEIDSDNYMTLQNRKLQKSYDINVIGTPVMKPPLYNNNKSKLKKILNYNSGTSNHHQQAGRLMEQSLRDSNDQFVDYEYENRQVYNHHLQERSDFNSDDGEPPQQQSTYQNKLSKSQQLRQQIQRNHFAQQNRVISRWTHFTHELLFQNNYEQSGWNGVSNKIKQTPGMENWIKLIKKVQNIKDFSSKLKNLDINKITKAIKSKNEKVNSLEIQGRWNLLVSKMLLRTNNLKRTVVMKRWHRMILKFQRNGELNFRQMMILDKKEMIAKLRLNQEKCYALQIQQRWSLMIRRLLSKQKKVVIEQSTMKWQRLILKFSNSGKVNVRYSSKYMKQMIQQLKEKDSKENTMKQVGNWKRYIDGIVAIDTRKQKIKENDGVHYSLPLNNWIKLIKKAQKKGILKVSISNVIQTLKDQQQKIKSLDAAGRWNRLTQLLLVRAKNKVESGTQKRWHKLILIASRKGKLNLATLQELDLRAVIDKLKEKDEKLRQLAINGRWNILYRGVLGKGQDRFSQNQQRWCKLVMKGSRKGYFKLKGIQSMHLKEVIYKLKDKQNKLKSLDAAGRWNRLVQLMLVRIKNFQESRTLHRWHRLILVASRRGKINLKQMQEINLREVIDKLNEKNAKLRSLHINGRWNTLIRGVLGAGQNRHSPTQQRWVKLVLKASRRGFFKLKGLQSMHLKQVISKLKEQQSKLKSLDAAGRWNRLVQLMLTRMKNFKESRTLPRWHKLILKASRRGKINLKQMQEINLRKVIDKLNEKNAKLRSLHINGRWNTLIRGVLGAGQNRHSPTQQRWVKLVLKASRRGHFKLKGIQSMHIKQVISKLKEQQSKLKSLDAAGRWNRLVQLMLVRVKNFQESRTLPRWHRLILKAFRRGKINLKQLQEINLRDVIDKLNEKNAKLRSLQINGRWNTLIRGITGEAQNRHTPSQQRWVKLFLKASRRGHFKLKGLQSLNVKTVISKLQRNHRKIHTLDAFGKWNRLTQMLLVKMTNKQEGRPLRNWHKLILIASRKGKINLKQLQEINLRDVIDKLNQKEEKLRIIRIQGRWNTLSSGLLGKSQNRSSTTQQRWVKLALKGGRRGFFKLKGMQSMHLKQVIYKLKDKQLKLKSLDAAGRWNRLSQLMLVRVKNFQESNTLLRWHRLILVASRKGKLNLKQLQEINLREVINRLNEKEAKLKSMRINGRWNTLIRGVSGASQNRFSPTQQRWFKLALKASRKGCFKVKGLQSLNIKHVISKLQNNNRKIHTLNAFGKWNRLAQLMLTRVTNKQANCTLKRWHKLILTASRRGKINLKQMQEINLRDVIDKLCEKEEKLRILNIQSRWNTLSSGITGKSQNRSSPTQQRWVRLVMKASRRGYFKLKGMQSMHLKQVIYKLKDKQQKLKNLDAAGRWNRLSQLMLVRIKNFAETNTLSRWHKLILIASRKGKLNLKNLQEIDLSDVIAKLKQKEEKLKQLRFNGRWNTLVAGVLGTNQNRSSPTQQRWVRLVMRASRRGVFKLKELQSLQLKTVISKLRSQKQKLRSLDAAGRWNMLAKAVVQKYKYMAQSPVLARWHRLILKANRRDMIQLTQAMDIGSVIKKLKLKQQKVQALQIAGRWRTLIYGALGSQKRSPVEMRWSRLMQKASTKGKCSINNLQNLSIRRVIAKLREQQAKAASLVAAGRWNKFTKALLTRARNERAEITNKRWSALIRAASREGYLELRRLQDVNLSDVVASLQEKEAKLRSLAICGRWREMALLLLKRETNQVSSVTMKRWHKLIRQASKQGFLQLRQLQSLSLSDIKETLQLKESKLQSLAVVGKWGRMTRQLLATESETAPKLSKCTRRWHSLIVRATRKGSLNLLSIQTFDMRDMIEKLADRQEKDRRLRICGKWRSLARHYLEAKGTSKSKSSKRWQSMVLKMARRGHINLQMDFKNMATALREHRLKTTLCWAKFARLLIIRNQNQSGSRTQKRWQKLILAAARRGEFQLRGLRDAGVTSLIQRLRAAQQKTQKLGVVGRWNRLVTGLLAAEGPGVMSMLGPAQPGVAEEDKQARLRRLEIVGRWSRLIRKQAQMQSKSRKLRSLNAIGRWGYLSDLLLKKSVNQTSVRAMKSWTHIIKTIAINYDYYHLKTYLNLDKKTILKKLNIKNTKLSKLTIQGRWNTLIRKLSSKQMKAQKKRQLKIYGRWNYMSSMLVSRDSYHIERWQSLIKKASRTGHFGLNMLAALQDEKIHQALGEKREKLRILRIHGKWGRIVKALLASTQPSIVMALLQQDEPAMRPSDRALANWTRLLTPIANKMKKRVQKKAGMWVKTIATAKTLIIDPFKKTASMEVAGKWNRLTSKLLQKDKIRSQKLHWRWRRLVNDVLKVDRNRRLFVQARFSRLIRAYILYRANRKKLQAVGRLRKLANKLLARDAQQEDIIPQRRTYATPMQSWVSVTQKVLFRVRTSNSQSVDWTGGMQKLREEMAIFNKQRSLMITNRWKGLTDGIVLLHASQSSLPRTKSKNPQKIINRWKRLVLRLEGSDKNKIMVRSFARRMTTITRWRRVIGKMIARHPSFANLVQTKMAEQKQQQHFSQETEALVSSTSRVRRIKQIKVDNPEVLERNIREGKERIAAEREEERLLQENNLLRKKLLNNQQLMQNLENEMGSKIAKQNEDFELVKQRENKLMFFLYVLKEEKKCPVTEVFDEFIKPIETQRFAADYGEDYHKVLKKIKKQSKYEKLYNRALKKMRQLNGNKEYKSDSCLPVQSQYVHRKNRTPDAVGSAQPPYPFTLKKVINLKNAKKGNIVKIPALDIVQLGPNNRLFSSVVKGPGNLAVNEVDKFNFLSSSSEDSKAKAKVKDIVFDPRQRKRLLDSLNIVTTRAKWKNLNQSD